MRILITATLIATLATALAVVQAEERPDHYKGEPAASLEQALENLSEYNARLAAILDEDELAAAEHDEIHQLTYTLEKALEVIGKEVDGMAAELEFIHVASEERDSAAIRGKAPDYLLSANKLVSE